MFVLALLFEAQLNFAWLEYHTVGNMALNSLPILLFDHLLSVSRLVLTASLIHFMTQPE